MQTPGINFREPYNTSFLKIDMMLNHVLIDFFLDDSFIYLSLVILTPHQFGVIIVYNYPTMHIYINRGVLPKEMHRFMNTYFVSAHKS